MTQRWNPSWTGLLKESVTNPGPLLAAYHAFHTYSLGNQLAALWQCCSRHLPLGPIASFQTWKERGRSVKKGEKALWLCMPFTARAKQEETEKEAQTRTFFAWRPHWFVLTQTEGADYTPPRVPGWDREAALAALGISLVPFAHLDGNAQGYAQVVDGRLTLSLNPIAELPHKTLFHEAAHLLLGHISQTAFTADEPTREMEAEAVALLCCATLGLPGADTCRGYIQHWWGRHPISEASSRSICTAADRILRAGVKEPVCEHP